ncbi:hypothetical protein ILYODFUR_010937 [Ilyodon furcidens]|uniref:Uncharacterized protein n=1 Tax=Ilyodon furcidens TaxID=33524 RepID=A0ABV0TWH4_9TELE
MAMWSKSSPASFCLSRYAPPMHHPVRHAGNGNESLFSTGFIIPGDVRAATSVELHMLNCAAKMDDPNSVSWCGLLSDRDFLYQAKQSHAVASDCFRGRRKSI